MKTANLLTRPYQRTAMIGSGFLLALLIFQPLFAAEPFETYSNSRFNYSIEYPSNLLIPQPKADNVDGQLFVSPDGEARMIIYGTPNVMEQTIIDLFNKDSQDASSAKITKTVTYKRQKNNWFVISGYIGHKIFYQKTYLANNIFKTFYIEYPERQRGIYDPVLGRLQRSFKG